MCHVYLCNLPYPRTHKQHRNSPEKIHTHLHHVVSTARRQLTEYSGTGHQFVALCGVRPPDARKVTPCNQLRLRARFVVKVGNCRLDVHAWLRHAGEAIILRMSHGSPRANTANCSTGPFSSWPKRRVSSENEIVPPAPGPGQPGRPLARLPLTARAGGRARIRRRICPAWDAAALLPSPRAGAVDALSRMYAMYFLGSLSKRSHSRRRTSRFPRRCRRPRSILRLSSAPLPQRS